jgi:hypothetical protein
MVFFCCGSWKYSSFVFVVPFSVSQALLVEAYTILKVYFCQEYCGTDVVLPSDKTAAQRVEVISAELWAVVTELNTVVSFSEYGGNFVLSIESEIEELCLEVNGNDGEEMEGVHESVATFTDAIRLETYRHYVSNV